MIRKTHTVLAVLALAGLAGIGPEAGAASRKIPLPKPRPASAPQAAVTGSIARPVAANVAGAVSSAPAASSVAAASPAATPATPAPSGISSLDIANLKQGLNLARSGKIDQAISAQKSINDPVARKLVDWMIVRSDNSDVGYARYLAFIAANPKWPSLGLLYRRAESALWQDNVDAATVRAFFAKEQPTTAKGRFALARALLSQGDRAGAQAQISEAWRHENFGPDTETIGLEAFPGMVTAADHKARMDMRLYAEDVEGGLRSAQRAGGHAPEIAKARAAVIKKAANAKALLDAVPKEAQRDIGLMFSRAQWLRRNDHVAEAAEVILSLPRDPAAAVDGDQWWVERRLIARKLLDLNDAKTAYRIAREAAPPAKDNYRVESQFTAGWIALRFLNDPATAQQHFARMTQGIGNPISLARGAYWQGRAAEAMGRNSDARQYYQAAAAYPTAYYGQIARARLGLKDIPLRAPPDRPSAAELEVACAVELLYAIGERDLVTSVVADLGGRWTDAAGLGAIGEVTTRHHDARATLHAGKEALARGLALEQHAFPTIGIPDYKAVGPAVETAIVYAIARQESTFNQKTVSTANALGLMQVTPAAGRYVAKKFGVAFDQKRLMSDPIYNVQMGAAELGDLITDYRGSYILAFAGYNAGRGRVRDWIAQYGDPRDPAVDPIDWVERIPFAETRNYVQRVLENLQVYRVRFGGGTKLLIEADLRRGAVAN